MSIVERLMKPGNFDLGLVPETPKSVRDILQPFGHILVYEAPVDPRIISDGNLLANSLYCGVLRRKPSPFSLSGAHITVWLGDEEGKGYVTEAVPWALTNGTFTAWVTGVMAPGFVTNIVGVVAGTLTQSFLRMTTRQALDFICQYFGAEYRARTDATNKAVLDAGLATSLFNTTPTVIVMPREGGRELGGLVGIPPAQFEPVIDADSYTQRVYLVGAGGTGAANQASNPYKDLRGNAVTITRVVNSTQTAAGQENTIAAAELSKYPLRTELKLSSDRYDVPHDIKVGDWLYVFDPENALSDETNPVNYRGQITFPIKLRLYAITWPLEAGMAVFYRDLNGVYTDITPYMDWEQPGTTFEVGAPVRGLTAF